MIALVGETRAFFMPRKDRLKCYMSAGNKSNRKPRASVSVNLGRSQEGRECLFMVAPYSDEQMQNLSD